MDFFHVWLRRVDAWLNRPRLTLLSTNRSAPKWNHEANDGELVDDSIRHGWDREEVKGGLRRWHVSSLSDPVTMRLSQDGRFVIVFAHKHPDAWETLVSQSSEPDLSSMEVGRSRRK